MIRWLAVDCLTICFLVEFAQDLEIPTTERARESVIGVSKAAPGEGGHVPTYRPMQDDPSGGLPFNKYVFFIFLIFWVDLHFDIAQGLCVVVSNLFFTSTIF